MKIDTGLYIKLGSSKEEVKLILGETSKTDSELWTFGASYIKFDENNKVIEWKNMFNQLDKGMVKRKEHAKSIYLGATDKEVLQALGSPTAVQALDNSIWKYESSHIMFNRKGEVVEWKNLYDQLSLGLRKAEENAPPIMIGSSRDDVLRALGSPKMIQAIAPDIWKYDASHIKFDDKGSVIEWVNLYDQLDLGFKPPEKTGEYMQIGSSEAQVLKILGSPTAVLEINTDVWKYDSSYVMFEQNRVVEWRNLFGQLDLAMKKPTPNSGHLVIGMAQERVLEILGSPLSILAINPDTWKYDSSHVKFKDKKVVEWRNMLHQLDLGMRTGTLNSDEITMGSDFETVLTNLGSPTSIFEDEPLTWHYGNASVDFNSKGLVVSWRNISDIK